MKLTDRFDDDYFEYNGRILHVDMSFDNILLLFEMFDDEELANDEKIFLGISMLIVEAEELEFHSFEEMNELFKYVMREFLDINLDNTRNNGETNQKFMDFQKDAELIYASFFAVYKIDLFEMHGKLHWKKFQALLTHLDDNSPFKQVIGYRTMKIPDANKVGKEYRDHVIKMKRLYTLDKQNVDDAFDALARTFRNAKGVKGNG